jgi:hypothetical protein
MVEIAVDRMAVVGIAAVAVVGIVVDIAADQMSLEFLHMLIEACPMAIATPDASSGLTPLHIVLGRRCQTFQVPGLDDQVEL